MPTCTNCGNEFPSSKVSEYLDIRIEEVGSYSSRIEIPKLCSKCKRMLQNYVTDLRDTLLEIIKR